MKLSNLNTIANTIAAEKAKKEAEAKEKAQREALKSVKKGTILDLLQDLYDNSISPISDANDNIVGILRNHEVSGIKCAKIVNGNLCVGADESELESDVMNLLKFRQRYGDLGFHDFEVCLMLKAYGAHPDKAIKGRDGVWYFVIANEKKVMAENGSTVISLEEPKYEGASKDLVIELLVAKLNARKEAR